jgi:hypothetical protein
MPPMPWAAASILLNRSMLSRRWCVELGGREGGGLCVERRRKRCVDEVQLLPGGGDDGAPRCRDSQA